MSELNNICDEAIGVMTSGLFSEADKRDLIKRICIRYAKSVVPKKLEPDSSKQNADMSLPGIGYNCCIVDTLSNIEEDAKEED